MTHWTDKYVGKPYKVATYDCCHLIQDIYEQELGQQLEFPTERNHGVFILSRRIAEEKDNFVVEIPANEAQDFDIVIMATNGRKLNHVGVYVNYKGIPCVIHAVKSLTAVIMNKIRDMEKVNLTVEGIYRFKENDSTEPSNLQSESSITK